MIIFLHKPESIKKHAGTYFQAQQKQDDCEFKDILS